MVSIPRAEYERLIEVADELGATIAYDRAMAAGEEGMPHDVLRRIVDGESPVRAIREWRGLTQAELARRADMHRVQVHDIETGQRAGSVVTLKRIAEALGVSLDDVA